MIHLKTPQVSFLAKQGMLIVQCWPKLWPFAEAAEWGKHTTSKLWEND